MVESLPGTPNAQTMASGEIKSGYHGCWVIALGTNDTADVAVGSEVSRAQRIKMMMALIGSQPVMWVEVKSILSSGPYAESNMELWNQALQQALPNYPNMRLYNWPAVVQTLLVHQRRDPLHLGRLRPPGPGHRRGAGRGLPGQLSPALSRDD